MINMIINNQLICVTYILVISCNRINSFSYKSLENESNQLVAKGVSLLH